MPSPKTMAKIGGIILLIVGIWWLFDSGIGPNLASFFGKKAEQAVAPGLTSIAPTPSPTATEYGYVAPTATLPPTVTPLPTTTPLPPTSTPCPNMEYLVENGQYVYTMFNNKVNKIVWAADANRNCVSLEPIFQMPEDAVLAWQQGNPIPGYNVVERYTGQADVELPRVTLTPTPR